jgi:lipopolysaccharide transport system ATP-binding protein
MDAAAKAGRTILFVSHNLGVVQMLCNRAILLCESTVLIDDSAPVAVAAYLSTLETNASKDMQERTDRQGNGLTRLSKIEISTDGLSPSAILATGSAARIVFYVTALLPGMSCCFTIYDQFGHPVTTFDSAVHSPEDSHECTLGAQFVCHFDELLLVPGRYRINVALFSDKQLQDHIEAATFFDVEQGALRGRPISGYTGYGKVILPHRWTPPYGN